MFQKGKKGSKGVQKGVFGVAIGYQRLSYSSLLASQTSRSLTKITTKEHHTSTALCVSTTHVSKDISIWLSALSSSDSSVGCSHYSFCLLRLHKLNSKDLNMLSLTPCSQIHTTLIQNFEKYWQWNKATSFVPRLMDCALLYPYFSTSENG